VFRHLLLFSALIIPFTTPAVVPVGAQSAPMGTSIGSLTEVVGRDGIGDRIVGYGVVTGLNGTGDDFSKSPTLAESYMSLLQNLQLPGLNEGSLARQKSCAVVIVTANVPYTAGKGDEIDVSLTSAFDAESLAGGRLDFATLVPPGFTIEESPIIATVVGAPIPLDLSNPVRTTLMNAGRIEWDESPFSQYDFIQRASNAPDAPLCFQLRLNDPWNQSMVASREIAAGINEDWLEEGQAPLATLREDGRVIVRFPVWANDVNERMSFISEVEQLSLDSRLITSNARVLLDRTRGLIIVGAGVRFEPTAVSVEGLQHVTIEPAPVPTQFEPIFNTDSTVGVSTSTSPEQGARLQELVSQMRKLQIPVSKQIDVIVGLRLDGALLNVESWQVIQ
jgi:flagellar P-ring protein precursor FlgI